MERGQLQQSCSHAASNHIGTGTITAVLQSRRYESTMERGQLQPSFSHTDLNKGSPDTSAPEAVTAEDAGPAHRVGCRDGQCIRTSAEGIAAAGYNQFNTLINTYRTGTNTAELQSRRYDGGP